ncbi:MAG: serine/threonine protein kinase [Proteobacteria bacterium]|nr:serine/threonine protein kinase [Cystobacterineae bacterium]MCL2258216.1 serine/threonine protein kinase [Cystobacterineae bacterium]MCL2315440.1 serine/threonine protein kinase [Pseudomonadota bacterium]
MSHFERLQACPNCFRRHDVSIYISGQKITCTCGIRFEVVRTETKTGADKPVSTKAGENKPALPGLKASSLKSGIDTRVVPSTPPDIPGYALREVVGRGGMGEVWRAEQISLKRTVAVKLLPSDFESAPEFVSRFEKEASALALLSHPNIVQVVDRGIAGGRYYIVMEYVSGPSLREKMSKGRLALKEAIQLISGIARAVDYMHSQGVIHRDLKPENILSDAMGNLKVADFGLAGIQRGPQEFALTATAVAMGSMNYMAPEQRKDAKRVDNRADIYALGVIFYEMLTGELPVGCFKLPSERERYFPKGLDEVFSQVLQTNPEARPARAMWIADVLETLLQQPAQVKRGQPRKRRHGRFPWWLLAALLGGLLAYVGFASSKREDKTEVKLPSNAREFVKKTGEIQNVNLPKLFEFPVS